LTVNGSFAEHMVAAEDNFLNAYISISRFICPFICVDETTFGASINSSAKVGDTVIIYAIGGLHLAVQHAVKAGFRKEKLLLLPDRKKIMSLIPSDISNGPHTLIDDYTGIQKTVYFNTFANIIPMVEVFSLEQANAAFDKILAGDIHFRAVLEISKN
jgi:D-arabinose 1-dehydrogenase-like Zn-dependent alcohol dehydrogenase